MIRLKTIKITVIIVIVLANKNMQLCTLIKLTFFSLILMKEFSEYRLFIYLLQLLDLDGRFSGNQEITNLSEVSLNNVNRLEI